MILGAKFKNFSTKFWFFLITENLEKKNLISNNYIFTVKLSTKYINTENNSAIRFLRLYFIINPKTSKRHNNKSEYENNSDCTIVLTIKKQIF